MFGKFLMVSFLFAGSANPIQSAIDHYQDITSYQMRVRTTSRNKTDVMLYYFKKPGYVRVEVQKPFSGAVLIYDPVKKQARLWPLGRHSLPTFILSPDNRLIKSASGQQIDRSDVGALYRNVKELQDHGIVDIIGPELVDANETVHLSVESSSDFSVANVHRYQLWLDQTTGFPIKVVSYDITGHVLEQVDMDQLRINPELPDNFFH
jgi:outer membrane lipoprotein-sorting protein